MFWSESPSFDCPPAGMPLATRIDRRVAMIPPKRVLVGVDFSECSRTALAFAARLAFHVGGELAVLHVQDPMLTAAARTAHVDLRAESEEELQRFIHTTPPADSVHLERFVICGAAGQVLCDIAAREQADVIVVGSHGMTGADRWLFGSNTERVIRRARMSVLVVPGGWHPPRADMPGLAGLGPVIAAVTVSEPALAAAHAAARLARLLGTKLTLLHVIPELRVPDRWMPHANSAMAESARRASIDLHALLSPLNEIAPVDLQVVTGDVAGSVLRAAESQATDRPLLVLGRQPADTPAGALGTVLSRALGSLHVPMLIVHDVAQEDWSRST
jgi:nucleotide-binding universal stress UspA family protein